MTVTRRRSRASEDMPDEERNTRSRRDEESSDERPRNRRSREDEGSSRSSRRSRSEDGGDAPSRSRRSRGGDDEGGSSRRRKGTSGFASYAAKKRSNSSFADKFDPDNGTANLIKFLDAEPFDTFNRHWIDEVGKGKRKGFVCREGDEYFDDDDGCPLCDIGESASTLSLWNVLDLKNPRKPEVLVWQTSPMVTDKLVRLAEAKRTSPLDRLDLYFEVTKVSKKNRTDWDIVALTADQVEEEFDFDAFTEEEIDGYLEKRHDDRTAVQQVDSYEDLQELADSLD